MNNTKKYILLILGVWVFVTLNAIWLCGSINAATWSTDYKGTYITTLIVAYMITIMGLDINKNSKNNNNEK